VTEKPFAHAHLSDIHAVSGRDGIVRRPLRRHFDIRAFGTNVYAATQPGVDVIGEHTETEGSGTRHEELYFVAEGHATFTVAGEQIDAPRGTFVFVRDPAVLRGAVAHEEGTTILVVGATPGEAYRVSPWERWADAIPAYEAKDYDRAIEIMNAALAETPDTPSLLYNLACCESLAGRQEDAIAHLRRAFELAPEFRKYLAGDSDFDPIRDDAAFVAAFRETH
jgi:hypothetical protein